MAEERSLSFDEAAQEVLLLLLENYWILRENSRNNIN